MAAGLASAACTGAAAQPAVLAGITLQDQRQHTVDAAALKGRPLLLNFVFTGCSSICPLQVRDLAQMQRSLPADVRARALLLSVSVDPQNDTPASMAAFAKRMDADLPGWLFATGAAAQVTQLIDRLQVLDARHTAPADHRTSLYLFNAQGALVQRFRGVPVDRARLADELTVLARAGAR